MSKSYEQAALKAMAQGHDLTYGNAATQTRDICPADPRSRRRCACCGKRSTHVGLAGGLALMAGCEMRVRRWVRDGWTA